MSEPIPASPHLTIELVPATSWFTNLRSLVSSDQWDQLRKATYRAASQRCEICGGRGPKWPVECHEIWEYDDQKRVQRLIGLIALCPNCHQVKHFGLARVQGQQEIAGRWLMEVNGWTRRQAYDHVQAAFALWEKRSQKQWEVDISWLEKRPVT